MLAVKNVIELHDTIVKRPRNHDDLKSRTRFRRVGDDAITPGLHRGRFEMVRIEIRQRGHRQDFSGARTDHDAGNAQRRVFLHALRQGCFNDELNGRINREHNVETVPGLDFLLPHGDNFLMPPILFGNAPAAHASEL